QLNGSPLGSLAMSCRSTPVPTTDVWLPGDVNTGTTAVFNAGATLTRISLASDGTPASSITNIIHMPGGTSLARPGICTDSVLPCALNGRSTKRCSMFQPWVAEPVLTNVTRLTGRAPATVICTVRPTSVTVGATVMLGLAATAPPAVHR